MADKGKQCRKDQPKFNANRNVLHKAADTKQKNVEGHNRGKQ